MKHRLAASLLLTLLSVSLPSQPVASQTGRGPAFHPPPARHFRLEHPQHRLAYWYANESILQAGQAREMVCGFTGEHWTLDWVVHYRWALRAAPRRAYERVEVREGHLTTCRSRKLREAQRPRYGREPGASEGRDAFRHPALGRRFFL